MKHTISTQEHVSALVDGQLDGSDLEQALAEICAADELRAAWRTYHLVGDVLRSGSHVPCSDSAAFLTRFQRRLADSSPLTPLPIPAVVLEPKVMHGEAANQPLFRWKLVAGVASITAAAAIGWSWMGASESRFGGAQLAQQQSSSLGGGTAGVANLQEPASGSALRTVGASIKPQVMIRDPHLDRLLEAHREAGGASQMPSGFLRNATFEGSSR